MSGDRDTVYTIKQLETLRQREEYVDEFLNSSIESYEKIMAIYVQTNNSNQAELMKLRIKIIKEYPITGYSDIQHKYFDEIRSHYKNDKEKIKAVEEVIQEIREIQRESAQEFPL